VPVHLVSECHGVSLDFERCEGVYRLIDSTYESGDLPQRSPWAKAKEGWVGKTATEATNFTDTLLRSAPHPAITVSGWLRVLLQQCV
jgi:hypothetical protein